MSEQTVVEQIETFRAGKVKLKDLPQSTQDAILSGKVPTEPPAVEPPEGQPTPEADPAKATTTEPTPSDASSPPSQAPAPVAEKRKAKSPAELRKLAQERADALNNYKQREKAHELRLQRDPAYRAAYFEKLGIEDATSAHRSEAEEAVEELRKLKAERALDALCSDLDAFLKKEGAPVSVSIKEIDKAARMIERVEGRAVTTDDLKAVGFSEDDANAYQTMIEVQQFQINNNYPTFKSAWADYQEMGGKRLPRRQATHEDASEPIDDRDARKDQIRKALASPRSLPASRGAVESSVVMDKAMAAKWLREHPDPRYHTPEESRVWKKVKQVIWG